MSEGNVSATVTYSLSLHDALPILMSNPIVSPAETGPTGFAVLVTFTSGQFTASDAEASWLLATVGVVTPSLEAVTSAVLDTVPQVAEVVVDTTCAEVEPVARSAGP